ncbi:uncharacterized protein LOC115223701 [Octopus sinensis]|uniref:Uncharacterized protein LOC115223701 n=1 Tax=Octopus sinensis TaxID=2607531 RepID=A0A6P7TMJ8_9MOLL|nr:uncharacterized protein LOC115223701 [Octopus sinensis]
MILKDHRISAKFIAETLEISCKRVGHILDLRKLSTKWMPKCLNAKQKCIRVTTFLDWFAEGEVDFMARLVTMDETWLHHYDLQIKKQSMEWRHKGLPRSKKSAGKILTPVFWDKDGELLVKYLPKDCTINAEYYRSLWDDLYEALK